MSAATDRALREPVDATDRLLTPAEVASMFRVDPKTVSKWSTVGRLDCLRTPGGHRRYRESQIRRLLEGGAK